MIHNPVAGLRHGGRFRSALRALAAVGCRLDVVATARPGDAEVFGRGAAGYDVVVAAGGDGTVGEVVNGLMAMAGPVPPLALLPLGTANVLAHEVGLSLRPGAVAAAVAGTVAGGRRLAVYPGLINGRYFIMMAGAGFDAQVVAHVDPLWKRRAGRLAYLAAIAGQAWRYDFPECHGAVDGRDFAAAWVVVCNGRRYGGPFVAVPGASLERPALAVCLLRRRGPGSVLGYGAALLTGRLSRLSSVRLEAGRRIVIDGPAGLAVQADGDSAGALPVEISASPRAVELLVPP